MENLHLANPPVMNRSRCTVLIEYILDEVERDESCVKALIRFLENVSKWDGKHFARIF